MSATDLSRLADRQIRTTMRVEASGVGPGFGTQCHAIPGDMLNYCIYVENATGEVAKEPRITFQMDPRNEYKPESSYLLASRSGNTVRIDVPDKAIKFDGSAITWALKEMATGAASSVYIVFQSKLAQREGFASGVTTLEGSAKVVMASKEELTNTVQTFVSMQPKGVESATISLQFRDIERNKTEWLDEIRGSTSRSAMIQFYVYVVNTGTETLNGKWTLMPPPQITITGPWIAYDQWNPNGKKIEPNSETDLSIPIVGLEPGNLSGRGFIVTARVSPDSPMNQVLRTRASFSSGDKTLMQDLVRLHC